MQTIGYYNGTIAPLEELMIPANDRSTYYADGVYDATYGRNHKIFALDDHIDRFYRSLAMIRIEPNLTKDELKALLTSLVEKLDSDEFCLYWHMTRGTALRSHAFPKDVMPNLLVTVRPHKMFDTASCRYKLWSVEDNRYYFCHIKTINLLPNVLANQTAKDHGCDEAIFIRNGFVTEGSHSNMAILKDGKFITAPLTNLILPGITRRHAIAICREKGIEVEERAFSYDELMNADEVIMMASSVHGAAISEIDGKAVGGKDPVTYEIIRSAMRQKFLSETEA